MKYLHQLAIIFGVTFLGEAIHAIVPLPIPAGIYGLLILLMLLQLGVVKLEWVQPVGNLLLDLMPVMFLPAAVGLIEVWVDLSQILIPILLITFLVNIIVLIVTGRVTEFILKREEAEHE